MDAGCSFGYEMELFPWNCAIHSKGTYIPDEKRKRTHGKVKLVCEVISVI